MPYAQMLKRFYIDILLICLTTLNEIELENEDVQVVKKFQTLQFHDQLRCLQTGIKKPS